MLSNSLTDYYENIVDQVMETTIEDIISSAPHTYTLIYPDHVSDCQASLCPFLHALRDHLNFMRANLIASVRPLVDSNLPSLPLRMIKNNNKDTLDTVTITSPNIANQLSEAIIVLNQRISFQLGLIINANEASDIIIRQSVPLTNSEQSSSLSSNKRLPSKSMDTVNDDDMDMNELIMMDDDFNWNKDEIEFYNEKQQSKSTKSMIEWLHIWLSDIEGTLYSQFDERIQDVIQSIMEDFLVE
ncbi:hypothetical protein BJ944DRAFT_177826 [Cunninghamella echinulata]|nr:hypothetical protein BJ944DRAFT_177826 [Cunninghamella echinulata]